MKNLLIQAKEGYSHPCYVCPFTSFPAEFTVYSNECMHCYELFPGWGDIYLDHDYKPVKCPCDALGKEFVTKAVQLFLKGDWV